MNMLASPTFWLTVVVVVGLGVLVIFLRERARLNRPTQRRGADPDSQPTLIVADLGEARFSRVAHAYEVSSDPHTIAKAFIPSDQKD